MINDSALKCVLRGCINPNNLDKWKEPSWKILVFVSSTFTDTHRERDFLMEVLLPKLRSRANRFGIDFTFVDMRLLI